MFLLETSSLFLCDERNWLGASGFSLLGMSSFQEEIDRPKNLLCPGSFSDGDESSGISTASAGHAGNTAFQTSLISLAPICSTEPAMTQREDGVTQ